MCVGGRGQVIQKFINKGQVVWTSKVFLWTKENQISQVKEFGTFLCMGGCKSLGLLKSFLSCASQQSGTRILSFSHPERLRAHRTEWLQPGGCQITGVVLLPQGPRSSEILIWRARITHGCGILVYWYGRNALFLSGNIPELLVGVLNHKIQRVTREGNFMDKTFKYKHLWIGGSGFLWPRFFSVSSEKFLTA